MTEQQLRNMFVEAAVKYKGCKESDGTHKPIIDRYNAHKPLARGYKVSYTDAWCATYVSAVAIECGLTAIIPTECSCSKMIELFKKLDAWVEADGYMPKIGDIIFYDWDDNGKGDNTGDPEHVGIVESVSAKNGGVELVIIEGNISNQVGNRTIALNGRYIRGYGVPQYQKLVSPEGSASAPVNGNSIELPTLRKGSKGNTVKAMQILLEGNNCGCGKYGADGSFGDATEQAVKRYQAKKNLDVDGVCGPKTWGKLLGV